jgi:uncharacterized membrane protein YeiH
MRRPTIVASANKARARCCLPATALTWTPLRRSAATPSHPPGLYESLPRYPELSPMGVLRGLDYMGTVSFAISGSVTAATCGLDLVGCTFVGCITALGGGTVRDCIFGRLPVFWLDEREYIYMSIAAAFTAFVLCCTVELDSYAAYEVIMFWTDTLGLGAFAVIGTMYAIRLQYGITLTLLCTLITCTGGGLIRDTLCRRPARVLYPYQETYAITTICGGAMWIAARKLHIPLAVRMPIAAGTVVALRVYAASTGFRLPSAQLLLDRQTKEAPEMSPVKGDQRPQQLSTQGVNPHIALDHIRSTFEDGGLLAASLVKAN